MAEISRWRRYQIERLVHDPDFAKRRAQHRANSNRRTREIVINKYGGKCDCCGELELKFLCLDHRNGGGNQDRKTRTSKSLYYKLKREPISDEFRVLCHNCNFAIGAFGCCPHQQEVL